MVWVPMSTGSLPGVWSTSVTLAISTTVVQALRFTPALEDELQKMEANVSSSIKQLILQSCDLEVRNLFAAEMVQPGLARVERAAAGHCARC